MQPAYNFISVLFEYKILPSKFLKITKNEVLLIKYPDNFQTLKNMT